MIERNLGNVERTLRVLLAVVFAGWAFQQAAMNAVEWFVIAISTALFLNGVFSRCYLWYVLDVNTCESPGGDCQPEPTCP